MQNDLINLDELRTLYGEDSVRELLEMCLGEAVGLIQELKQKVSARNGEGVAVDAHQLKGMSATMTMKSLAELSHKLELCAKSQTWSECDELLLKIESTFEEVQVILKKVLV